VHLRVLVILIRVFILTHSPILFDCKVRQEIPILCVEVLAGLGGPEIVKKLIRPP
jgi:hypothetical protein